jgi:hypothetical protein
VVAGHAGPPDRPARVAPYRPRARVLPGADPTLPARERVLALTQVLGRRRAAETVVLDPAAAADRILDQLRAWGYLRR